MANDLINIENIQNDFCIYEIEYETREYELQTNSRTGRLENKPKRGKPKWNINKSFYNLRDKYKTVIKVEYRYAIDRQIDVARRYGLDYNNMLRLLDRLAAQKLLPLSLQPRKDDVKKCKGRRTQIRTKIQTDDEIRSFHSVKLYRYIFRAQIFSYLIQKRADIFEVIGGADDRNLFDKMILVFRDMNTDTSNCITFNQAVDNLYNKVIGEWKK